MHNDNEHPLGTFRGCMYAAPVSLALWVLIILTMLWTCSPAGAESYADCSVTAINRSLERLPPGVLTPEELATVSREMRLCTAVDVLKRAYEPPKDDPVWRSRGPVDDRVEPDNANVHDRKRRH